MDNNILNYKEILVREPFYEILPSGYKAHRTVRRGQKVLEPNDRPTMRILTQADFLRMYYPTGHAINDPTLYPDIVKYDKETKKYYVQPIMRTAFAFQKIIATKQIVHIVGNDVQFELSGKVESELKEKQKQLDLVTFRQGWLDMDMEYHFYEGVRSIKIVGDTAVVGYFDENGEARARTLSYLNGDTLYPHYKADSDEMELFARKYYDIDENGKYTTEYVEVWDDKYLYRARKGMKVNAATKIIQRIKEVFGISGYEIYEIKEHGFDFCPVAYYRDEEGACFLPSQATIETYEEAFSYFCENNRAYAFPIMWSKGDGVHFNADELTGAVKYIEIEDPDGEAGFMNKPDVSVAFNTQLKILYDMIYEQSFGVKPPELKSGDLPGVAVKLLFSPAIELAIHDSQKLQPFLNQLIHIVKYAYGFQENCQASLLTLNINAWIEPYIHQNLSELMQNLAVGVQNEFISKQTASERASVYAKNDEIERILKEDLDKRKLNSEFELAQMRQQTENEIKKIKAQAGLSGNDINTGYGTKRGRPNRTGEQWDESGNYPGRNGWRKGEEH